MTVLDNHNSLQLAELFTDEEQAFQLAYNYDMLYDEDVCESTDGCTGNYQIIEDGSQKTGYRLKCSVCGKTKTIFYNSIFTRYSSASHEDLSNDVLLGSRVLGS